MFLNKKNISGLESSRRENPCLSLPIKKEGLVYIKKIIREHADIFLHKDSLYIIGQLHKASFSIKTCWFFRRLIPWHVANMKRINLYSARPTSSETYKLQSGIFQTINSNNRNFIFSHIRHFLIVNYNRILLYLTVEY